MGYHSQRFNAPRRVEGKFWTTAGTPPATKFAVTEEITTSLGWLSTFGSGAVVLKPGDAQRLDAVGFERLLPSLELFG